jgi:hypothetical protein
MYAYVLRYSRDQFEGMPGQRFRAALSKELGITVGPTYEPLNHSPYYQPQTKRRHRLDDQWNQIDPLRFDLPVAEHAYEEEAVVIPHEVLLSDWEDLAMIVEAVERVRDQAARESLSHPTVEHRRRRQT